VSTITHVMAITHPSRSVHTMGLTLGLGATICAGTTIVFPLTHSWPPSPVDIVRSFRATKVTTCIIVPLLLEQLVHALDNLQPLIDLEILLSTLLQFALSQSSNLMTLFDLSWWSSLLGEIGTSSSIFQRQSQISLWF